MQGKIILSYPFTNRPVACVCMIFVSGATVDGVNARVFGSIPNGSIESSLKKEKNRKRMPSILLDRQ